jgi:catechol 2,3-dioxygenase-like lactoylglutathione lyase family enzyme
MIETYGLTHIALSVQDLDRSLAFYQAVFGMVEVHRGEDFVQAHTPGSRDVIVFKKDAARAGQSGGVIHFGFRLTDPALIDKAAIEVERAGGTIRSRGDFCPGEPFLFVSDPDGYEVEIWHELPTKVDP